MNGLPLTVVKDTDIHVLFIFLIAFQFQGDIFYRHILMGDIDKAVVLLKKIGNGLFITGIFRQSIFLYRVGITINFAALSVTNITH